VYQQMKTLLILFGGSVGLWILAAACAGPHHEIANAYVALGWLPIIIILKLMFIIWLINAVARIIGAGFRRGWNEAEEE